MIGLVTMINKKSDVLPSALARVMTRPKSRPLRTAGCDEMQGYYFSRPVSADALAELMRERRILQFTPATVRSNPSETPAP